MSTNSNETNGYYGFAGSNGDDGPSNVFSQGIITLCLSFVILFILCFMFMYCQTCSGAEDDDGIEDVGDPQPTEKVSKMTTKEIIPILQEQGLVQKWDNGTGPSSSSSCSLSSEDDADGTATTRTTKNSPKQPQGATTTSTKQQPENLPVSHGGGDDNDTIITSQTDSDAFDVESQVSEERSDDCSRPTTTAEETEQNSGDNGDNSIEDDDDHDDELQQPCCSICLSPFQEDDPVVCQNHCPSGSNNSDDNSKCRHEFHLNCMAEWLSAGHDDCPLCRSQFWVRPTGKEGSNTTTTSIETA